MIETTRVPINMVTLNLIVISATSIKRSCERVKEGLDEVDQSGQPMLFADVHQELRCVKAECDTIQDTLRAIVRASKQKQQPTLFGGKAVRNVF